jgi:hypothetical protein
MLCVATEFYPRFRCISVCYIESKGAALEFDGPCSGRQVHGSVFFLGGITK